MNTSDNRVAFESKNKILLANWEKHRKMFFLLSIFFVLSFYVWPSIGHSGQPPITGDWIVDDITVIENQDITLNGNLIVQAGGNLTLKNIILRINATYDGQYGIAINNDGAMFISDSKIMSFNQLNAYSFAVNGSSFEMLNSEVHQCGWGPDSENFGGEDTILSGDRGVVVTTTGAVIQGNLFSDNYIGIILSGNQITLDNNLIHINKVHGIYGYRNSACEIINNTIQHGKNASPFRMVDANNNNIFNNEIISSIHRGIISLMWSSGNQIVGNRISGLGVAVLSMFVSSNNSIKNNIISTDECGVEIWGWDNLVEGNTISNEVEGIFTGIYAMYAYNSIITGNKISDVNGENGIWLRHSSNNKVANNSIQAIEDLEPNHSSGISLINSSKNNIIGGNYISNFSRGVSILYSSNGNKITGNELSSNNLENIIIDNSENNMIYMNNFLNNDKPPYDNSNNEWFSSNNGNYWSDYTGPDINNDNIGDDPYNIYPSGIDNFPLKAPVSIDSIEITDPEAAAPPSADTIFSKIVTGVEVIENQTINLGFIDIEGGAILTLRNVDLITGITDRSSSLQVSGKGELVIDNCKFTHTENGYGFQFNVWPTGSKITVKNSEFNGVGHEWWHGGIQISSATIVFENNTLINSPIWCFESTSGSFIGNTFLNNYYALRLGSSNNFLIRNNIIEGSVREAIVIQASNNTSVIENTIKDTWKDGIFAFWCQNNIIGRNTVIGINNDFIAIQLGGNDDLANQNIISNFSTGIRVGEMQTVSKNKISNCSIGIDIGWNNSQVEDNEISGCTTGILLSGQNHELSGNTIADNITGLSSEWAIECTIFHNNFIKNETQARESNFNNFWDMGISVGGNYWSDYTGVDANGDGMGDTSHNIDCCGVDHYPLVLPKGFGISSTEPKANITDVPVDTTIAVTFYEPMDTSTITSDTFYFKNTAGLISGTVTFSGTTATISPSTDLDYSTMYTATLTTGVKDISGKALLTDFSWSFTTQSEDSNGSDNGDVDGEGNYTITNNLWAKAVLEVAGSPVNLVWKMVGADITPSGDQVISGYFYADSNDFAYGSQYNPEVFVKIYIAINGWANIAFSHVTVDPVSVYSAHNYTGIPTKTGRVTLANRFVEHSYTGVAIDNSLESSGEESEMSSNAGYIVSSDLWAKAILQPTSGPVNLIWKKVGTDTTPSGDQVTSGYFYASPDDFPYGSPYNPELFVKIYIATNGWANIAFNHVTVDGVDLSSAHNYSGTADQSGTAMLNDRLIEHQYSGVSLQ